MITQDYKQFRAALEKLGADLDESAKRVVTGMRDVAHSVTVKNTPVGVYPDTVSFTTRTGEQVTFKVSRKQGGTLKRAWKRNRAKKVGKMWESGLFNNTEYGIYVNNGHRVVNKDGVTVGYVKGVRMLEQGIDAARRQSEPLFRQEIASVKQKGGW